MTVDTQATTAVDTLPHHDGSTSNGSSSSTSHPALEHGSYSFATRALHVGSEPHLSQSNGVIPSIDLSTTYLQSKVGVHKGFEYTRSSNPTRLALERLLASLEGADILLEQNLKLQGLEAGWTDGPAALAFASGSAATATVVSGLAGRGGHIVSVGDVYGGTSRYMTQVASVQQGTESTFIDMSYKKGGEALSSNKENDVIRKQREEEEDDEIVKRVEGAIREDTKMIWAETPTNPLLSLVPIHLISQIAKRHKIPLIIDNTFAAPYFQNPLLLGADVVVSSSTKYINGHSDVLGGAIITADPALLSKFRFLQNAHGAVPSAFDCWLVIRGIKTLSLRSRQHGLNALLIANWLEHTAKPAGLIRDVRYPGLKRVQESSGEKRERELAWRQMSTESRKWAEGLGFGVNGDGGFPCGGMVSFHINSGEEGKHSQVKSQVAEQFLENLHLFALAESLGGVESLAELPLLMTHAGIPIERRRELGLDGELIRLSVGIEDGEDLRKDVEKALRGALKGVDGKKA